MSTNVIEVIPMLDDAGAETLIKSYCIVAKREKIGNMIPVVLWGGVESANISQLREHDIEIVSIYKKRNMMNIILKKMFGKWYIPWQLDKIARKNKVTSVHFHLNTIQYAKGLASLNRKLKLFYTCHSVVRHYFPNKHCSNFRYAKKMLHDGQLRLIALHEEMKNELDEYFEVQNTVVIRNGIDFSQYLELDLTKEECRKRISIPVDAFVIGHVGRFEVEKNHARILELFEQISRIKEDSYLVLVGDGTLKQEIYERAISLGIEKRVIILSHRSDVNIIMKALDVFLFPSIYEGLGMVLIEAQLSGVKCVVSDCVPKEVCITDLVHYLSLNQENNEWIMEILKEQVEYRKLDKYEMYDMKKVLFNLFDVYY